MVYTVAMFLSSNELSPLAIFGSSSLRDNGYTGTVHINKLVTRRIGILQDKHFITVLQIKRLEYVSNPVGNGAKLPAVLEELQDAQFTKIEQSYKMFSQVS